MREMEEMSRRGGVKVWWSSLSRRRAGGRKLTGLGLGRDWSAQNLVAPATSREAVAPLLDHQLADPATIPEAAGQRYLSVLWRCEEYMVGMPTSHSLSNHFQVRGGPELYQQGSCKSKQAPCMVNTTRGVKVPRNVQLELGF